MLRWSGWLARRAPPTRFSYLARWVFERSNARHQSFNGCRCGTPRKPTSHPRLPQHLQCASTSIPRPAAQMLVMACGFPIHPRPRPLPGRTAGRDRGGASAGSDAHSPLIIVLSVCSARDSHRLLFRAAFCTRWSSHIAIIEQRTAGKPLMQRIMQSLQDLMQPRQRPPLGTHIDASSCE